MIVARREHEFCYGHRVVGHEGKCKNLHGHNAKVVFVIGTGTRNDNLDSVGRVIDFSVIKDVLCQWLEDNWDHKMLLWKDDPLNNAMRFHLSNCTHEADGSNSLGLVTVPFNPTAENMANYLLYVVGPKQLEGFPVDLLAVEFFETSKCSVVASF